MLDWILSLTPHQLDVLRTLAIIIGSGCVPLFGFILTWLARIINKNSKQAVHQTATSQWADGQLYTRSVADLTQHSVVTGEAARQEIADFYQEWAKGTGKRRMPTTEITPIGESHYE